MRFISFPAYAENCTALPCSSSSLRKRFAGLSCDKDERTRGENPFALGFHGASEIRGFLGGLRTGRHKVSVGDAENTNGTAPGRAVSYAIHPHTYINSKKPVRTRIPGFDNLSPDMLK